MTEVLKMLREADPKPSSQTKKKNSRKRTRASVTVTVVRDRKIRTALRTNQIVGFVTVSAWKKIIPLTNRVRGSYCKLRTEVSWIFVISHLYCVCLTGLGTISSGHRQAERLNTSEIIV